MAIDNPMNDLLNNSMEKIKSMVDANTIIGDTVRTDDGTLIIPISKVSLGFASGGSEFPSEHNLKDLKYPFGGGCGAGVSVKPVAFLVIHNNSVKLLPVEFDGPYDKFFESIPNFIETIKNTISKFSDKSSEKNKTNSSTMDSTDNSINLKK